MWHMTTEPRTSGLELKVQRIRAKVAQTDLARAMGISSSRLSRIEQDVPTTPAMQERYLDALTTCRTSGTEAA